MTVDNGISLHVLTDVTRRAIERWPESRGRIERGAQLLVLGHVYQLGADAYEVRSGSDDAVTYLVSASGCECVDAVHAPRGECKHRLAVMLLEVAQERQRRLVARQREQAARARFSADRVAIAAARSYGRAS